MANKPLKSLTFPGLSDTYTIPEIDDTLTLSGKVADAKKVGDELSSLHYTYDAINTVSQGLYVYGNSDSPSKGYLRKSESFVSTDFIPVYDGMKLYINGQTGGNAALLFAYDKNYDPIDNIIWDGSGNHTYTNTLITITNGIAYVRASFIVTLGVNYSIKTDLYGFNHINNVKKIPEKAIEIFTDDMIAGATWTAGQSDTTLKPNNTAASNARWRISSNEIVTLPFGCKTKILVRFHNSNYRVGLRFGDYVNHLDAVFYYYSDGDVIDVSKISETTYTKHPNYFTASYGLPIYKKDPGSTDDTAKQMTSTDIIEAGLKLYALNEDSDIYSLDANKNIANAKVSEVIYETSSYRKTIFENSVILHTSDCHGDEHRIRRFLKLASHLNVDLAAITGDIVAYNTYSGFGWFHNLVNAYDGEIAICTGNHDVYIASQTDNELYTEMFKPIEEKLGITTGKTYYYKDLDNKKIRIISVNLYQYDGQEGVFGDRGKTHFNTDQINWIISTLSSTPKDYGVIILEHSPQRSIQNAMDEEHSTFFQTKNNRSWDMTSNNVNGAPIYDIIDAFIDRTTINKTYTQSGTPSSITVSANFSTVTNGVEFIAYMSGHVHMDSICYVPDTNKRQLILNTICTLPMYGGQYYSYLMDGSDIGRDVIGSSQDAFNAYVIDRLKKTVTVIRIGADTTIYGKNRIQMEIPYGNWKETICTIANGSLHNPSNTQVVNTTEYIPVENGQVAWCDVKHQLSDNHYYAFSYCIYDSGKNEIKYVDYNAKTILSHIKITDENAKYIRFAVVEYNHNGIIISRRATDYEEGDIIINISI